MSRSTHQTKGERMMERWMIIIWAVLMGVMALLFICWSISYERQECINNKIKETKHFVLGVNYKTNTEITVSCDKCYDWIRLNSNERT
jgi:hypothetical protein